MNDEEFTNRGDWLDKKVPKRNTKIDNSDNRIYYLELITSRQFTSVELEEMAREKGEKISERTFRAYNEWMQKTCSKFYREPTHIEKMIASGTLTKEIDTLSEMTGLIRYQKERLEAHAKIDETSPIARREQSNDVKVMQGLLERYDEMVKEKKGLVPREGQKEEGKKIKSIDDYNAEEERDELLRIADIEKGAEKSRLKAKKEKRFEDKGGGKDEPW